MEYSAVDLSPVKKKVTFKITPEDVDNAIAGAVNRYRTSARINGFRKGKVPPAVIEKLYHDKVYADARQALISGHLAEALAKMDVQPCSSLDVSTDAESLARGHEYAFSVEFEIYPGFEIPDYQGIEVDQVKTEVADEEVNSVIDRLLQSKASLVHSEYKGPVIDGQIANINFQAYENGQARADIHAENFDMDVVEDTIDDFERLVRSIHVGEEKEGEVHFPEDFFVKKLAGKTLVMKVRLNAIKERELPVLDDDFARTLGFDNVDKFRGSVFETCRRSRENLNKGRTEKTILDTLLQKTDFALPESIVNTQLRIIIGDLAARLEMQGRTLGALGKSAEELEKEFMPQAERMARDQIILLAIARKEGLSVSENEVLGHIYRESIMNGQDFATLKGQYENSGMIHILHDRLLADKTMDLIYDKAVITYVDKPVPEVDEKADAGTI